MFAVLICMFVKLQNVNLLMMGTADALPIEPVTKTTFVEDLTENQLAKAVNVFLLFFLQLRLTTFRSFAAYAHFSCFVAFCSTFTYMY